jgi:hypothetical protein
VIITSFPYWPARRSYDVDDRPIGFGLEPTWEEFRNNQVHNVGGGMKRVLRDDGVLFVVFDDAIAMPSLKYRIQAYSRNRAEAKPAAQTGFRTQDSTYLPPEGNWLLLRRYAMAMQFLRCGSWCGRGNEVGNGVDFHRPGTQVSGDVIADTVHLLKRATTDRVRGSLFSSGLRWTTQSQSSERRRVNHERHPR